MSQIRAGIILSYISIIIANLAGLITTPIIVNTLGAKSYGVYLLLLSFVSYIGLVDLGITNTINRFIAKYRALNNHSQEKKFISLIIKIILIVITLILGLGFFLVKNIEKFINPQTMSTIPLESIKLVIWGLLLALILNIFTGFINGYLAAYENFIFIKAIDIVKVILRLMLLWLLFMNQGDILFLVILDLIIAFMVFFSSLLYFVRVKRIEIKMLLYDKSMLKEIMSYSIWVFVFSAISQIQWQSGQIIIGYKLPSSAVAIYGIGIVLGTYYGAFAVAISGVFISRTTYKVYTYENSDELTKYMIEVGRMCAFILMLILINFISIGKGFIQLWVGKEFLPAWLIALMIMITYSIPLTQSIANQVLEAKKMFSFKSKVYLVCLILGTLLGYILLDYYNISGMAFGIIIGWAIAIVIMNFYYHFILRLDMIAFFKSLKELAITTVIVTIFGYGLNLLESNNTWVIIIFKSLIISFLYLILIYKFVLNNTEKLFVRNIRGKLNV